MKKQTTTKIILGLIIFALFVSMSPVFSITAKAATDSSMSDLYSNPNQSNSENPYKVTAAKVLKSGVLQSVIGCTGVVNKISTWMAKFLQSPAKQAAAAAANLLTLREQLISSCASVKAGAKTGAGITPFVNNLTDTVSVIFSKLNIPLGGTDLTDAQKTDKIKACKDQISSTDDKALAELKKQTDQETEANFRSQCLDGIAITLAKNQLTAMTRSAVNWVNSGYGGNPFFVQSMTNLTNGIERNVLETGIDVLLTPDNQSPYARDFAKSAVTGYDSGRGLGSSSLNFLSGLQSDLGAFVTDPKSYYTNEQLGDAQATRTALQRAQDANNAFANDFATGGWNGWLALTQRDQNNPLGYTMLASQNLADTQARQITQKNNELAQNNGFLNQKVCIKWQVYNENGSPKISQKYINWQKDSIGSMTGSLTGPVSTMPDMFEYTTTKPATCYKAGGECCAPEEAGGWKNITPGSIIKDKTTNYLNSPERQLELAKTINDSLNALFSILISKLESGGLSGLSDNAISTANWTDSLNGLSSNSIDSGYGGSSAYDNNGAYDNFNLTRDLGNNYVYNDIYKGGDWDAKNNIILTDPNKGGKMSLGYLPPVYKNNSGKNEDLITSNIYWEVTTPGNVELVENGYNGWEVGDRAFWDGSSWQNWKCQAPHINVEQECSVGRTACINASHDENYCQQAYYACIQEKNRKNDNKCTNQLNPIKKRGVIQVQKDYLVAAKEILKVLPNVMPKLGELDYCLPGPNPNYKVNSTDAQGAFSDWVGSLFVGQKGSSSDIIATSDRPGTRIYDNLLNTYSDTPNVLKTVLSYIQELSTDFNGSIIDGGFMKDYRTREMEYSINYTSNYQFNNFYEAFDKMMDKLYFKNMTSKYLEYENRPLDMNLDKNPAYIPMSEAGLNLTKDIVYYNDEVSKSIADYKDTITQTQLNISKLEPIKVEVSQIIKAAQDRRDAKLLEKIKKDKCDAEYKQCTTAVNNNEAVSFNIIPKAEAALSTQCDEKYKVCMAKPVSDADKLAYKTKYAGCLEEENIKFFDVEDITGKAVVDPERCNNGIDDDLDGLIDAKDPDCQSNNNNNTGNNNGNGGGAFVPHCVQGAQINNNPSEQETDNCVGRTEGLCTSSIYYHLNKGSLCEWVTENSSPVVTTSLYGCVIDPNAQIKNVNGYQNNLNCFKRTREQCTSATPYSTFYYNNNNRYTCKLNPVQ